MTDSEFPTHRNPPAAYVNVPPTPIRFMVCVNDQEEAEVALRLASIKARKRNGTVDILHVIPVDDTHGLFGVGERIREERYDRARMMLADLSTLSEEITGMPPNVMLQEGAIGETIVAVAQDSDVNMVVLGVVPGSSKGKLVAWLSTQLGEKLLMPIMLVPGNLTDQQIIEIS